MSFPSEKGDCGSDSMAKTEFEETILAEEQVRRSQLKMQFYGTRKGDLETVESYVEKLKSAADSLAAIDSPISDPDLVLQLLAGLPCQYLPYQTTISSKSPLPDFPGACSLLYMYEKLLQEQITSPLKEANFNSLEEGNNTEKFDKILSVFSTVSDIASTAWDLWSMFGASSTTSTSANIGNKKNTKRHTRGRGNYRRGSAAGSYRNSGRK